MPWNALLALALLAPLPNLERTPRAQELAAYPEDGKAVEIDPPGFCWTPQDQAKAYRLEVQQAGKPALAAGPLASTVYPPEKALAPGEYTWRVVYLDAGGTAFGVSQTRRFTVRPGLPELPMPDVARLKTKLAGVRPRLFLAGGRLDRIRQAIRSGREPYFWNALLATADAALKEPTWPEPPPYPKGKFTAAEWRRIYTPGKVGSANLARAALAWRLTGRQEFLDDARRWMRMLASWDPRGITSHRLRLADGSEGNDEASMPMLERMAMAWDWMGDRLSRQDRARLLEVIAERGNQVLRILEKQDFLSHPFSNHEGRALAFLGLAGLSFLGDIPEAERWLDYVLRCYLTSYPGWGGDGGGWAQGVSYWSSYVYWLTTFAEALRGVTEVDILRRPFFRNTGYFALYMQPPYAPRGAFGDGGYHPPSQGERLLIDYLAGAFDDPVLRWHAEAIGRPQGAAKADWREWFMEDVVAVWRTADAAEDLAGRPPGGLDGSRLLADIGWAAMHSDLGNAANDVWVLFKASRFGSFSHSHGDQNTFMLNAYGRALAIDSGYYPWYGSPHDELWTRQTRAHNGILVNGRGQPPHNWDASGRIESFERDGVVTIVRGQAAQAYNLPQPNGILRLWKQSLEEPVPPMEPKVVSFERTLAFVGDQARPFAVIQDVVRTDGPATFDWLLHALNEMQVDEPAGTITVRDGEARLLVRLAASTPVRFSQRAGFPVAPEVPENTAYIQRKAMFPDQWHLKATTGRPATQMRFLAVLAPYRASEPPPKVEDWKSTDSEFGVEGWRVVPGEKLRLRRK